MWYISDIKARARGVLAQYYWMAFVSGLIVMGISGTVSVVLQIFSYFQMTLLPFVVELMGEGGVIPAILLGIFTFLIYMALVLAVQAFLLLPIEAGISRYYLCLRYQKNDLGKILSVFSYGYGNVVKIQFFRSLFIMLWSMLLVIPGIYKTYEYAMVPYLLAENPSLDSKRVFELSKLMMQGEKMHLFGLQMSFIGWFLLSFLTCGIGSLFLGPYVNAAQAEVYAALREKMFYFGYSSQEELPGFSL